MGIGELVESYVDEIGAEIEIHEETDKKSYTAYIRLRKTIKPQTFGGDNIVVTYTTAVSALSIKNLKVISSEAAKMLNQFAEGENDQSER